MALAKPVRALGLAAVILCVYLFYQVYTIHDAPLQGPGDLVTAYDGKDPMNERMLHPLHFASLPSADADKA